jgi:surface carbohydrate biosynthesis protein
MTSKKPALLMPVENQVRELDARLLLACVAARRGLTSIIGPKRDIESRIASFPRGIFLSKSLRVAKRKIFPLARKLGHEIVSWDEEALVHLPPETYFTRRLPRKGLEHVSHLFAWGEDNAELWRQYPKLPAEMPIHVTGNPRGDLLRPEMQAFYNEDSEKIRNTYGNFILINTNFNHVNAFYPDQNLFKPVKEQGKKARFGQAARGMTREYAEGLRDHKQAIFEQFQKMIPDLEMAFPDYNIVVRPHPTENQEIYHRIAAQCKRVRVTNEGNVVPWLMATRVLLHNGCTTGVEAYAMGVPSISYRATVNDNFDLGFYRLSNGLSHQCFDFTELQHTLGEILAGKLGCGEDDQKNALIDHHLTALSGPLACERIVDVLLKIADDLSESPKPPLRDRLEGWFQANRRSMRQRTKSYLPGSPKPPEFLRHRYPVIPTGEVGARLARFQQVLGDDRQLSVEQIYDKFFQISS